MNTGMPVDEQLALLMRGTEFGDAQTRRTMERELRERLEEGRPLRVYCGYDPTTVDLHLGHTISMRKLHQFQELGHEVTFLIGNFTGLVGDPSDKDRTRPIHLIMSVARPIDPRIDPCSRKMHRNPKNSE